MDPLAAQRIVSLAPSATDTLWELKAHSNLVAVTKWCKEVVPPEAITGLPIVEDCWSLDAKQLHEFEPDLVIGSVPYRAEVVTQILAEGFRFLAKSPRRLTDIYGDIRILAAITHHEDDGELLVAQMKKSVEDASCRGHARQSRPRVYCEAWPNPIRTCEPWVAEMVEAAGGEFVPLPAGRRVSADEVISADPDFIILAWNATGGRSRPDQVRRRPGWEKIKAVRQDRIHVVQDEWLNAPSPILLRGLGALACILNSAEDSANGQHAR